MVECVLSCWFGLRSLKCHRVVVPYKCIGTVRTGTTGTVGVDVWGVARLDRRAVHMLDTLRGTLPVPVTYRYSGRMEKSKWIRNYITSSSYRESHRVQCTVVRVLVFQRIPMFVSLATPGSSRAFW